MHINVTIAMEQFITNKNRKALWDSISQMRSDLFSETVDDSLTLERLEEVKIKLDFAISYLRTARLYKSFQETKGDALFDDIPK